MCLSSTSLIEYSSCW